MCSIAHTHSCRRFNVCCCRLNPDRECFRESFRKALSSLSLSKKLNIRSSYTMRYVEQRNYLTFSEKLSRLRELMKEAQWRRYGTTLMAGKLAGVGLTLLVMAAVSGLFFAKVYAADA